MTITEKMIRKGRVTITDIEVEMKEVEIEADREKEEIVAEIAMKGDMVIIEEEMSLLTEEVITDHIAVDSNLTCLLLQ